MPVTSRATNARRLGCVLEPGHLLPHLAASEQFVRIHHLHGSAHLRLIMLATQYCVRILQEANHFRRLKRVWVGVLRGRQADGFHLSHGDVRLHDLQRVLVAGAACIVLATVHELRRGGPALLRQLLELEKVLSRLTTTTDSVRLLSFGLIASHNSRAQVRLEYVGRRVTATLRSLTIGRIIVDNKNLVSFSLLLLFVAY